MSEKNWFDAYVRDALFARWDRVVTTCFPDTAAVDASLETPAALPPEATSEATEAARERLLEFIRQAWPVVEPGTTFVPGWHLEAVCEHLEAVSRGQILRLVINIPPRHAKSLTGCVFWPAWEWASRPRVRWLFASYAQGLSVRDSLRCRRLLLSNWYQLRWGHVFRLCFDQNAKHRFENDHAGWRVATSVAGMGTGEGGDRVVADDPHNARQGESEKLRESALEWWDQTMATRLDDPAHGAKVIIMQRLHQKDLAGHVLEQGGYVHLKLPAAFEGQRICSTAPPQLGLVVEDRRTTQGEPLWPKRFGAKALADLRTALGSYGAAGQLQQRPAPAGGGVFKREWWKFWTVIPRYRRLIQSWDTAFKTSDASAYSVGQTWAEADDGFYLLDQVRERLEYPELKRALVAAYDQWRPDVVLVEDKASGQSLVQDLARETRLPLKAVRVAHGDKVLRAHTVSPLVEAGRVFLPARAPWLAALLEELALFPNAAQADQVDALTQALRWFSKDTHWRTPEQTRY